MQSALTLLLPHGAGAKSLPYERQTYVLNTSLCWQSQMLAPVRNIQVLAWNVFCSWSTNHLHVKCLIPTCISFCPPLRRSISSACSGKILLDSFVESAHLKCLASSNDSSISKTLHCVYSQGHVAPTGAFLCSILFYIFPTLILIECMGHRPPHLI